MLLLEHPDPLRWPATSAFLHMYEREQRAARERQPTLRFAYGASLDRAEATMMYHRRMIPVAL